MITGAKETPTQYQCENLRRGIILIDCLQDIRIIPSIYHLQDLPIF